MTRIPDRKEKLLHIVVQEYIKTGKPVASKFICDAYNVPWSSATIRNELAELEYNGFLTHPHTSAGRIPTDKGYRYYVDSLVEIQNLAASEEERITHEFEIKMYELQEIMRKTSQMLAMVSNYAGFIITPNLNESNVQHVELIKIEANKILAIIVTEDGLVKHKIIPYKITINDETLRQISRNLNNTLRGVPISHVKEKVIHALEKEKIKQAKMLNLAQVLAENLFFVDDNLLYLEGTSNIINLNEENEANIYKILEEKNILQKVLTNASKKEGINIFIGTENDSEEMSECSLITSSYKSGDKTIGVLGIIGPRRMEYAKMISLVNFMSSIINKMMNKKR